MNKKAQADIIAAVLIIIIAISLAATAYMWGIPLIQKRQDMAIVERVYSSFDKNNANSLTRKIEFIANNGGEDTFTLDVNGIWILYPADSQGESNSIYFTFRSRASNLATNINWIPLSSANTNPTATVGIDDPSVVFGRADSSEGAYNITYKLWFRQLNGTDRNYLIKLLPRNPGYPNRSTAKTIRISRGEIKQDPQDPTGKLIITEIKILFG
ncbi:MAG: hypothetical protein QMD12_00960 [Candidatus Aenigmarchaeota archaeon]|nr:hypothetical protein [Candidatus Aenigmarchaeota archaeon]